MVYFIFWNPEGYSNKCSAFVVVLYYMASKINEIEVFTNFHSLPP